MRGWRRGDAGADQQEIEVRDPHQNQGIAHASAGVDFVSGAAHYLAQVSEHVGIAVEAQNAAAGANGRLSAGTGPVRGADQSAVSTPASCSNEVMMASGRSKVPGGAG